MNLITNSACVNVSEYLLKRLEICESAMKSTSYEELTAVGTLLAVVVALFVAFLPYIIGWLRRPKLILKFKNAEPFCRHTGALIDLGTGNVIPRSSYHVRLRILNEGYLLARTCEVKLVAICDQNITNLRSDFDPVVLHWVGSDNLVTNSGSAGRSIQYSRNPSVNINSREYEYVDFLSTNSGSTVFEIQAIDRDILRGTNLDPQLDAYFFLVSIYSENSSAKSTILKTVLHGGYDNFTVEIASRSESRRFYKLMQN